MPRRAAHTTVQGNREWWLCVDGLHAERRRSYGGRRARLAWRRPHEPQGQKGRGKLCPSPPRAPRLATPPRTSAAPPSSLRLRQRSKPHHLQSWEAIIVDRRGTASYERRVTTVRRLCRSMMACELPRVAALCASLARSPDASCPCPAIGDGGRVDTACLGRERVPCVRRAVPHATPGEPRGARCLQAACDRLPLGKSSARYVPRVTVRRPRLNPVVSVRAPRRIRS